MSTAAKGADIRYLHVLVNEITFNEIKIWEIFLMEWKNDRFG